MTTPNSAQGAKQESVRAVTGTAYDYNGDWHALFDLAGIPVGDFSGRMLAYINQTLGTTYPEVNGAQYAFAIATTTTGALSWSGLGEFVAGARISLTSTTIAENFVLGDTIATISVVGGSGVYTFTEVSDPDNKFTVTGTSLKSSDTFDYETKTSYLVTIEADNGVDPPVQREFTITITNVIEDSLPNAFSFTPVTEADHSATYTSNSITVLGTDDPNLSVTIVGGFYSKNGGVFTGSVGTAGPNDTFRLQGTAGAADDMQTDVILTIGGVSGTFSILTHSTNPFPNNNTASSEFLIIL